MRKLAWLFLLLAVAVGVAGVRVSGGADGALAEEAGNVQVSAAAERAYVHAGEQIRLVCAIDGPQEGEAVSYQWQRSLDGTVWHNVTMSGADQAVFAFAATGDRVNYMYRVAVSRQEETWYSNAVKVGMIVADPVITISSDRESAVPGVTVTLTARAVDCVGSVSWQWQASADGQLWEDIDDNGTAQSPVFRFVAMMESLSVSYRVRAEDDQGTWYSNILGIQYVEPPVIMVTSNTPNAFTGEPVALTVSTEHTVGTVNYRWHSSTDGTDWTPMTAAGSYSRVFVFDASEEMCAPWYQASVSDANGTWWSNPVRVEWISIQPTIVAQPSKSEAWEGETLTVSVSTADTVGELSYRWQESEDGIAWKNVDSSHPGYNSICLQIHADALELGETYRCSVMDDHREWVSNTVQITLIPNPIVQKTVLCLNDGRVLSDLDVVDYDDVTAGPLTISWHAQGGNGLYSVKAILTDETPGFTGPAQQIIKTILDETESDTVTVSLSPEEMKLARYLQVLVSAQDAHYSLNHTEVESRFVIRIMPSLQVSHIGVAVNDGSDGILVYPNCYTVYDYKKHGPLKLQWSVEHGNGAFSVKAILVNEAPDFSRQAENIVKTILFGYDIPDQSVIIPTDDLRMANYLKVWIDSKDERYHQNGYGREIPFALRLTDGMPVTGKIPGGLQWTLAGEELSISGRGEIPSYNNGSAPWYPYRETVTTVMIEDGVTSVGSQAFSGMKRIEEVVLPETLTGIDSHAFADCPALVSLRMPESLIQIHEDFVTDCATALLFVRPYSFTERFAASHGMRYEYWLKPFQADAFLPPDITVIETESFAGSGITGIALPDGTERIETRAFAGCELLKMIYIPESVVEIADNAFEDVPELCIYTPEGSTADTWAKNHGIPCGRTENINP